MATQKQLVVKSWNVNGIRACAKKGLFDWLQNVSPDIAGLQEVRAQAEQLDDDVYAPPDWHRNIASAQRKGYSGVGLYCKTSPDSVETSLGEERFDDEGRVQIAYFGKLVVANIYFPNGNGKDRDNSRVPYKLDFYRALYDRLQSEREAGRRVIVMGDFNTAHRDIDLARPKENRKTSGFLPEECEEVDRWIAGGWIDSFREFESEGGHYSWWSQRGGARGRNVGWRIDYIMVCPAAREFLQSATIDTDVLGSDHCPIGVTLDRRIIDA